MKMFIYLFVPSLIFITVPRTTFPTFYLKVPWHLDDARDSKICRDKMADFVVFRNTRKENTL